MYAHKVIEDLSLSRSKLKSVYVIPVDLILKWIKTSEKFHIGDVFEFSKLFKQTDAYYFWGEEGEGVRPPYQCCWFDASFGNGRLGMLVRELKGDLILVIYFGGGRQEDWGIFPTYYLIAMDRDIKRDDIDRMEEEFDGEVSLDMGFSFTGNIMCGSIYVKEVMDLEAQKRESGDHNAAFDVQGLGLDLQLLNTTLLLLTCKNIITETVYAPAKLNKARKKKNKKPIYSYKILEVIVPRKRKNYKGSIDTEAKHRLHMCRGHFKYYTDGNPLFGRLIGRYWWESHVRGSIDGGTVDKDYNIKGKK